MKYYLFYRLNGEFSFMKKLQNIAGYPNIQAYIKSKIAVYEKKEKNFASLFEMMFSEKDNIMAEITDGYRIKKLSYGEFRQWIIEVCPSVKKALDGLGHNSMIGIYMNNSMEWLVTFWAVLACGYKPLLLNTRFDDKTINSILKTHSVSAVVSDNKIFETKTLLAKDILIRTNSTDIIGDFGTEIIFMSSGTTENVKLCSYTGENFYYQVCCSADIVSKCPDISKHYEGELRQLCLLPFYHVFGFIAVYLWFGFFSRTFVFLRDMNPQTILNTVKKHRVTHIFAVPLVWDSIYREAHRKIKSRGEATYNKFNKALNICNKTEKIGDLLAGKLLSEVRENIFGNSIRFMISGGSAVDPDVIRFFNGLGYPLVNGYGMTEVGITSVEMLPKKKTRNLASIGQPFSGIDYKISDAGELLIKSRARAYKITSADTTVEINFDEYFNSHDLCANNDKGYFISGRADDLIVCENGENINPFLAESLLKIEGTKELCLFASNNIPVLIISAPDCSDEERLNTLNEAIRSALKTANLADKVKKVIITPMALMEENDFKISRRKIAKRYNNNEFTILTPNTLKDYKEKYNSELEEKLVACFAEVLEKDTRNIGINDDFYTDLGASSLDYFILKEKLRDNFNIDIKEDEQGPTTVKACLEYLNK